MAVIGFMPDYGHAQPLLKIADALSEAGFEVTCYLPRECERLMDRFDFDTRFFDRMEISSKSKKILSRVFSKGLFFNNFSSYVHHDLLVLPAVAAVVGRNAQSLSSHLKQRHPDIVITDEFYFREWYERIAASTGSPMIINSLDGNLAHGQRSFVRAFGVTRLHPWQQSIVEGLGAAFARFCSVYYRILYVRTWLRGKQSKRAANDLFDRAFSPSARKPTSVEIICTGTAAIERARLSHVLNVADTNRRVFPLMQFRTRLPVPPSLEAWMMGNSQGEIVYVSFGSAVEIDLAFASAVYEGLRTVSAHVLWSIPTHQRHLLTDLPPADNIRLELFVPQPEILQNPLVKCFVTQAGPWSVQEALFGATPMLCIPFFADQGYNSSIVDCLGIGRRLWPSQVTSSSLRNAVQEILTNESYRLKAENIRDQIIKDDGRCAIAKYVKGLIGQPVEFAEPT